jgi:hypothetical protein
VETWAWRPGRGDLGVETTPLHNLWARRPGRGDLGVETTPLHNLWARRPGRGDLGVETTPLHNLWARRPGRGDLGAETTPLLGHISINFLTQTVGAGFLTLPRSSPVPELCSIPRIPP